MPSHHEALQGFSERLACVIKQEGGRAKKQAFARKIGVKPQQLSRYLKGQLPDAPTLLAIAEVGQVSVDWLLTGREVRGGEAGGTDPASLAGLRRLAQLPVPVVLVLLRVIDELEALGIWEQLL
jgi:transcriptional regulator with XRE-family HTH domain